LPAIKACAARVIIVSGDQGNRQDREDPKQKPNRNCGAVHPTRRLRNIPIAPGSKRRIASSSMSIAAIRITRSSSVIR
jgi:hypothetical protein